MDRENKLKEAAKQKFTDYLTAHKHRKTPERFAILDLIYAEARHFDIETLYEALIKQNFRVSRATLYNTLQLLEDCRLIQKHQVNEHPGIYERINPNDFHHHLVCSECGSLSNYKDAALSLMLRNKKIRKFTVTHHSLYFYGLCDACSKKLKKQNKNK
jgi:Fur family ferric uptake transcriptional regulator